MDNPRSPWVMCVVLAVLLASTAMFSAYCHTVDNGKRGASAPSTVPNKVSNSLLSVGIIRSEATAKALGWRHEWQLRGAASCFARLGTAVRYLTFEELAGGWDGDLLVLSDVRMMSSAHIEAVRQYCQRGGSLLATYQTSYRTESNKAHQPNALALGDLFGVEYLRWSGLSGDKAAWTLVGAKSLNTAVRLGDGQAMLVKKLQAESLANWVGDSSPALVKHGQVVYSTASLFAPENSDSPQIVALVGQVLEQLFPGRYLASDLTEAAKSWTRQPPCLACDNRSFGGQEVLVGLPSGTQEIVVAACPGHKLLACDKVVDEVQVRFVDTIGKKPEVRLYDMTGKLLGRSNTSAALACQDSQGWLQLVRPNANLTYSWSAYRGQIIVSPGQDQLNLVNRIGLEDYLRGVVPNEVPAWFDVQALAAMSVVARTYTLAHLGRHQSAGYDLCSSVHCHVYQGLASENRRVDEQIAKTMDQVICYQGELIEAAYHAACGGMLETASNTWNKPSKNAAQALCDLVDVTPAPVFADEAAFREFIDKPSPAYCQDAGNFRWSEHYTLDELTQRLHQSLPVLVKSSGELGQLLSFEVLERFPSGRAATVRITMEKGRFEVAGDKIRWLVSQGRISTQGLKSTLFYVTSDPQGVHFVGGGWGHGVGLCQEGAEGLARRGRDYMDIIRHYYPGTELSNGYH